MTDRSALASLKAKRAAGTSLWQKRLPSSVLSLSDSSDLTAGRIAEPLRAKDSHTLNDDYMQRFEEGFAALGGVQPQARSSPAC